MPVRKSSLRSSYEEPMNTPVTPVSVPQKNDCGHCEPTQTCERHSRWCGWVGRQLLTAFIGILLVYLIVFLGTLIRNEIKKYEYIGKADTMERTVRVEAEGKVSVKPDVAMTRMGVATEAPTVAEAQQKNTEVVNTLVARIKQLGIDDADVQTQDYNVYPMYNYTENGGRTLRGYEISQNVSVKIRDLSLASQVLALAGEVGATNVSGLEFTIDDRDVYIEKARSEALVKAREKAQLLSKTLGLNLVSVVSYDEYEVSAYDPYYGMRSYDMGYGGEMAPQVEAGTKDVVMRVGITFELR